MEFWIERTFNIRYIENNQESITKIRQFGNSNNLT